MIILEQYALLLVVALPTAVIAVADFCLAVSGEEGTLILPGPVRYPAAGG